MDVASHALMVLLNHHRHRGGSEGLSCVLRGQDGKRIAMSKTLTWLMVKTRERQSHCRFDRLVWMVVTDNETIFSGND
eukprot:scaffold122818_cov41-Cyclotella_meneghiniana.AAC.1